MLELARRLDLAGVAYVALEAARHTWYPKSFLAPVEENQPDLDHAIARLDRMVEYLAEQRYAPGQIVFLGFSQGACLLSEFVLRRPQRWGGLVAFTGGLIGAELSAPCGTLEGTPVLISGSSADAFVPLARMADTAAVFQQLGAQVRERYFPGSEHLVNDAQITEARILIREAQGGARRSYMCD
jgi:predicted esterase